MKNNKTIIIKSFAKFVESCQSFESFFSSYNFVNHSSFSSINIQNDESSSSSLLNDFTLIEIMQVLFTVRFRNETRCDVKVMNLFNSLLNSKFITNKSRFDEIVNVIDQFFFNQVIENVDNENHQNLLKSWKSLNFHVDFNILNIFLNHEWIQKFVILNVFNVLIKFSLIIQLFHFKLSINVVLIANNFDRRFELSFALRMIITSIVIFFNSKQHWLVVYIIRQNIVFVIIVYNFLFDCEMNEIKKLMSHYAWFLQRNNEYFKFCNHENVIFRSELTTHQHDFDNCDIYIIVNVINLLKKKIDIQSIFFTSITFWVR